LRGGLPAAPLLAAGAIGGIVHTSREQRRRRSSQGEGMSDFAVRMKNRLQFSSCEAPCRPTTKIHEQMLDVQLRGDLLTIREVRNDASPGSRIHARRTVDLPNTTIFMILPELPSRVRDGSFFPALGTVAVFHKENGTNRRLRAVGTDTNSGHCRGWIFDAVEV
jgi:hypothetical protein